MLSEKLARAESVIDYVTQRKLLERLFFRYDGRPVKPLRRLLFHTSGKPRRLFRRLVLHKDATPRKAFARWMQNRLVFARVATQQAARLTAERDALSGETNRIPVVFRDLEAPLPPPSDSGGFARPDQPMESLAAPPPPPQFDVVSEFVSRFCPKCVGWRFRWKML